MSSSLMKYSYAVHQRDKFICQYCGLDGSTSFANWLTMTRDHLLPTGHPNRENDEFIVTSCQFCNVVDNRYFSNAEKRGIVLDDKTRQELVEQRKPYVMERRENFHSFWKEKVVK